MRTYLAFALGPLVLNIQACGHGCTEMGCNDHLSGTIETADGTWSEGDYVITFTTEKGDHKCSMKLPDDFPSSGTTANLPCEPGSWGGALLEQDADCTEVFDDNSVSQSCTPIPNKYTLRFGFAGTPDMVAIQIERDGVVLADETYDPDYEENQPNGKGCPPVCRQAEVALSLP